MASNGIDFALWAQEMDQHLDPMWDEHEIDPDPNDTRYPPMP